MMGSKWRIFLTAFLVVFLGGMGVSGAAALWSQSGVIKARVTTGTWIDYSRPNYSMPLKVEVVERSPLVPLRIVRRVQMSWELQEKADTIPSKITYVVDAKRIDDLRIVDNSLPQTVTGTSVSFVTTTPVWPLPSESIEILITPYVNNVAGTPTRKILTIDNGGWTSLKDPPK
jgi:hypothetical protein